MSRKSGTRRSGTVPKGKLSSKFEELYTTSLKLAPKLRGEDGLLTFDSFLRSMYQENKNKNNINVEESSSDESDYAFLYNYDSDSDSGSHSPTAKRLFTVTEKPAIYYEKPPGLNENRRRSLRIEPDHNEANEGTTIENGGLMDSYTDDLPFYEEPIQAKKGRGATKSKAAVIIPDVRDDEMLVEEERVLTPKTKKGRGNKSKAIVEEIIPDTYDENMIMDNGKLPIYEEPQPKRGKRGSKSKVLSEILPENIEEPKKGKRGSKTIEKSPEPVQKSKNKRPAEEPVVKPDSKKRRQSILLPQSKTTYALEDKRAKLSPNQYSGEMLSRRERRSHMQPLRFWKGERMEYLHTHTPVKVVYMKNPTLTTPHK